MLTIDLASSQGNAFFILSTANSFMKQLDFSQEKQDEILAEMTKGSYDHLIEVFRSNFGEYAELVDSRIDEYDEEYENEY